MKHTFLLPQMAQPCSLAWTKTEKKTLRFGQLYDFEYLQFIFHLQFTMAIVQHFLMA